MQPHPTIVRTIDLPIHVFGRRVNDTTSPVYGFVKLSRIKSEQAHETSGARSAAAHVRRLGPQIKNATLIRRGRRMGLGIHWGEVGLSLTNLSPHRVKLGPDARQLHPEGTKGSPGFTRPSHVHASSSKVKHSKAT